MSTHDREKLTALWRDWLRVFFGIPVHYLYPAASVLSVASASASSIAAAGILNPTLGSTIPAASIPATNSIAISSVTTSAKNLVPQQDNIPSLHTAEAWPIGTRVITLLGSGVVMDFRAEDGMHTIQLAFGKAYMTAVSIMGPEELSPQALQAIGVSREEATGSELVYGKALAQTLAAASSTAKVASSGSGASLAPLVVDDVVLSPSSLFFGTQQCYVFLRIHHTLYSRLALARSMCTEALKSDYQPHPLLQVVKLDSSLSGISGEALDMQISDENEPEEALGHISAKPRPLYKTFMSHLYSLKLFTR